MLAVGISPAFASVLLVDSYDMPNGNGQFVYGTYNYWDGNYSGSGIKTGVGADNAPLSGGRGALTDGVIPTTGFGINSNNAGTGLYVGWKFLDPVITFHLDGAPKVFSVDLYVDYMVDGSLVGPPAFVTINGTQYSPTVTILSPTDEKLTVSFAGGITLSTFTVQPNANGLLADAIAYLQQYPNPSFDKEPWMMVSEVQFNGIAGSVPELSTWAMLLIGFAAIGFLAYRRKHEAQALVA